MVRPKESALLADDFNPKVPGMLGQVPVKMRRRHETEFKARWVPLLPPIGGTTHTTTRSRVIAVGERIDGTC